MSIMTETNPGGMTIGIDLAVNILAVHGVDQNGKAVLIKSKVLGGRQGGRHKTA